MRTEEEILQRAATEIVWQHVGKEGMTMPDVITSLMGQHYIKERVARHAVEHEIEAGNLVFDVKLRLHARETKKDEKLLGKTDGQMTKMIKEGKITSHPGSVIQVTEHELTEEGHKALSIGNAKIPGPEMILPPVDTQGREVFQATLSIFPVPIRPKNGYLPVIVYFYPKTRSYEASFPELDMVVGGDHADEAIQMLAKHIHDMIILYQFKLRGEPETLTEDDIHAIEVLKAHLHGV